MDSGTELESIHLNLLNNLTLKLSTLIPLEVGMALLGNLYSFPHSLNPIKIEKINKIKGHLNLMIQKIKKNRFTAAINGTIKLRNGYSKKSQKTSIRKS